MELSQLELSIAVLCLFALSGFFAFNYLRLKQRLLEVEAEKLRYLNERDELISKNERLERSREKSVTLEEFLYDQSRYGYSFVRVDPSSVMLRSPRDVK